MQANKWIYISLWLFFLFVSSGCYCPSSQDYREFYSHLCLSIDEGHPMRESPFFLVILVDARHLDYTDTRSFFQTVARHPSDGSKNGDIGHAWIYLQGAINGKVYRLEGGHSGERGRIQAKYFDGIMNYNDWGYANPTEEQKRHPRYEPNPAIYLWTTQEDGFFQKGSGGHQPTFAAKIDLTEQQFRDIMAFIHPRHYAYRQYAITGQQCCSYVAQVASLADFYVAFETAMAIEPRIWYGGQWVRFWEDPQYAAITFGSPDIVEKSLMLAVQEGRAECALSWYLKKNR